MRGAGRKRLHTIFGAQCTACRVFLCCMLLLPVAPLRAAEPLPLQPGEKLHYSVSWLAIKAADATLEILPREKLGGAEARHFAMTVRTTPLVDVIYPVFDRMDSWADAAMTRSLKYKEHKQTRRTKDIEVVFDWDSKTVQYSKKGKKPKHSPLLAGAFDPLAIFYYFRTRELREDMVLTRPVSDGKKCVIGRARVKGRQKVTAGGREYDTFLVEPDLTGVGGVFKKSPDAKLQIWVTADQRRLPVVIKSKVVVGSFIAELDEVEIK